MSARCLAADMRLQAIAGVNIAMALGAPKAVILYARSALVVLTQRV